MKSYTIRFRSEDTSDFDLLKTGRKSIETRAASERYRKITTQDTLIITCGNKRVTKTVKRVYYFKSIGALLKALPLKKIMPNAKSEAEARKTWNSYTGYKDRIKQLGIVAWELK